MYAPRDMYVSPKKWWYHWEAHGTTLEIRFYVLTNYVQSSRDLREIINMSK